MEAISLVCLLMHVVLFSISCEIPHWDKKESGAIRHRICQSHSSNGESKSLSIAAEIEAAVRRSSFIVRFTHQDIDFYGEPFTITLTRWRDLNVVLFACL